MFMRVDLPPRVHRVTFIGRGFLIPGSRFLNFFLALGSFSKSIDSMCWFFYLYEISGTAGIVASVSA